MILCIDCKKAGSTSTINGYFDIGNLDGFSSIGFQQYLKDNGYKNIRIYYPTKNLFEQDLKNMTNFQTEFGNAIKSIKYYPRNKINDHLRYVYAKSHPINMNFETPETKPGAMY